MPNSKTRAASITLAVAALTGAPAVAANAAELSASPDRSTTAHAPAAAATQTDRQGTRTATPACGCEHHRSPGHHKAHHPRKPKHHKPTGHHPGKPTGHKPCPPPKPKPCPPPKHHHPKPPVVVVHPRKPVLTPGPVTHVTTPAARVRHAQHSHGAADLPAALAFTASPYDLNIYAVAGVTGVGGGVLLVSLVWLTEPARRFNRQAKR